MGFIGSLIKFLSPAAMFMSAMSGGKKGPMRSVDVGKTASDTGLYSEKAEAERKRRLLAMNAGYSGPESALRASDKNAPVSRKTLLGQ